MKKANQQIVNELIELKYRMWYDVSQQRIKEKSKDWFAVYRFYNHERFKLLNENGKL